MYTHIHTSYIATTRNEVQTGGINCLQWWSAILQRVVLCRQAVWSHTGTRAHITWTQTTSSLDTSQWLDHVGSIQMYCYTMSLYNYPMYIICGRNIPSLANTGTWVYSEEGIVWQARPYFSPPHKYPSGQQEVHAL